MKSFANWALFCFLPISLAASFCDQTFQLRDAGRSKNIRTRFQEVAQKLLFEADDRRRALRKFQGKALPSEEGFFAFSWKPDPKNPFPTDLAAFFLGRKPLTFDLMEDCRKFVGWNFNPKEAKEKQLVPLKARWGKKPALLIWKKLDSAEYKTEMGGGSAKLALFFLAPLFDRCAEALVDSLPENVHGAVLDFDNKKWRSTTKVFSSTLEALVNDPPKEETFRIQGNRASILIPVEGDTGIFLEGKIPWDVSISGRKITLLGGVFLILLSGVFFRHISFFILNSSLKVKISAIFLFVVFLPLVSAGILSIHLLNDQAEIKRNDVMHELREDLLRFDDEFHTEHNEFKRFLRKLLKDPDLFSHNLERLVGKAKEWIRQEKICRIEVRGWENNLLLLVPNDEWGKRGMAATQLLFDICLMDIPNLKKKPKVSNLFRSMVETVKESTQMDEIIFRGSPTEIKFTTSRIGGKIFYVFPWFGNDIESPIAGFSVFRFHDQAVRSYLRKRLLGNRNIRIFVRNQNTGELFPRIKKPEKLERLFRRNLRSGSIPPESFAFGKKNYLGINVPGMRILNYDLAGLVSEDLITKHGRNLKAGLFFSLAAAVGFALICGYLVSSHFLLPVEGLSQGIEALRIGNRDFRIPIFANDELGKVSMALNSLLETKEELNIARVLQKTMLPSKIPDPAGYQFGIFSKMSSEIGGDFIDCIQLADSSVAMILGDVAGHGVEAALLMAMTKAYIFRHFSLGRSSQELIDSFNTSLCQLPRIRQMVSIWMGIFSPRENLIRSFSIGHPFPLLWREGTGSVLVFGNPSYPLGVVDRLTYQPVSIILDPGDVLLAYTDGIVEAVDRDQRMFGYTNLANAFSSFHNEDLSKLGGDLFESLSAPPNGFQQRDDISFLMLRRSKETSSE